MTDDDDTEQRSTRRHALGRIGATLAATPLLASEAGVAQTAGSAAAPRVALQATQEASYVTGNVHGSTGGNPAP